MNENNIKALFPEGVETITISKNDYDRLYGQLTYENIILKSKIDEAIEYIEKSNFFDHEITVEMNGEYNCGDDFKSELLDILKEND